MNKTITCFLSAFLVWCPAYSVFGDEPLPSWNNTEKKQAIIDFVKKVTESGAPTYVAPEERIAVFDNDGTLWSEQPFYFQLAFAFDRIRALAPTHPEWKDQQPFKAVIEKDLSALKKSGVEGLTKLLMASHSGMTTAEFDEIVQQWISTAKHSRFQRPYTDLIYQPMLELLKYLRSHEFKTYIVSGGGRDFMRPWVEEVYGIPPEQVIGSRVKITYGIRNGQPVLLRLPEMGFVNDKSGKPVGIHNNIGRRPIAAFGNSDGDFQMLQWTASGDGPRLMVLVHHTDSEREWAYDRQSKIGRLDHALEHAPKNGWTVVDMKKDWKVIFPFEQKNP